MTYKGILLAFSTLLIGFLTSAEAQESRQFREGVKLYDYGMYSRSRLYFDELNDRYSSSDPAAYAVLCDVRQRVPGYHRDMARFIAENPQSPLIPQIRYAYALNLFDSQDFAGALEVLGSIEERHLARSQRGEFTFRKAHSAMETGNMNAALEDFKKVEKLPMSDYTAPSRYAIGYINYDLKNFEEAIGWFEKSAKDARFADLSSYYIMECRFMLGDHRYVASNGADMYADRKSVV